MSLETDHTDQFLLFFHSYFDQSGKWGSSYEEWPAEALFPKIIKSGACAADQHLEGAKTLTSSGLCSAVARDHYWDALRLQPLPPTIHHSPGVILKRNRGSKHSESRYVFSSSNVQTHSLCLHHQRQRAPWFQWSLGVLWPADIHRANRRHCASAWQHSEHRKQRGNRFIHK